MRMSLTTTWGSCSAAAASSSGWSAASPTTSMSASRASSARTPERTRRLSSARTTVITPSGMRAPSSHDLAASRRGGSHASLGGCQPHPSQAGQCPWVERAVRGRWRHDDARRRAMKIESRVVAVSWIPSEAVKGAMKAPVRAGHRPLRRAAARRARRSRGLARSGTCSASPTTCGPGSAWTTTARSPATATAPAGVIGSTTMGLGSANATFQAVAVPDPAARARGGRRLGAVPADGRRPHRCAGAPAGGQAAVRAVPRAHGLVDAVAHASTPTGAPSSDARRRQPLPAPLGLRTATASWPPRPAWSTSRTGTATPSATTARGAARTRRRSSPRSSRRWSASCRG